MVVRKRLKINGPAIAFITTTAYEWNPILTMDKVAEILINELKNVSNLYNISIISYVIMPSHIHLLVGFPEISLLSKTIQGYKSVTSRQIKKLSISELKPNSYKLWKPRFDDLIINSEKQLKVKLEYIHNNPVKAGLVKDAGDWKYSSAADWLTEKQGLIRIDKDFKWLMS